MRGLVVTLMLVTSVNIEIASGTLPRGVAGGGTFSSETLWDQNGLLKAAIPLVLEDLLAWNRKC